MPSVDLQSTSRVLSCRADLLLLAGQMSATLAVMIPRAGGIVYTPTRDGTSTQASCWVFPVSTRRRDEDLRAGEIATSVAWVVAVVVNA